MDDKIHAIKILVESLKLYVTISTISIIGLLTYFINNSNLEYSYLFYLSIILLFGCSIASIANLNHFVTIVFHGDTNIFNKTAKITNWIAIILFSLGILFGAIYIYDSTITRTNVSRYSNSDNGIIIDNDKILIGNDVKTKLRINKDTSGHITEIKINQ